ncbi:MAG: gliding motility-associated C-terminal domain-containing protein [Paludibacteraceae bacterium]|nr:gliding motility-associated C-terminal domain-containing protein [Paludibacteraceae bacterium]
MKKNVPFFLSSNKHQAVTSRLRQLFLGIALFCIVPLWAAVQINSVNTSHVSCNGLSDGSITIVATGGSGVFQYSLDNFVNSIQSNSKFINLPATNYWVYVRDANNHTDNTWQTVSIAQPLPLTFNPTKDFIQSVSCHGASTGKIRIEADGGNAPYLYIINSLDGSISYSNTVGVFDNLPATTYFVQVKDANGCITNHADMEVTQAELLEAELMSKTKVVCKGGLTATARFKIKGRTESCGLLKADTTNYYTAKLYNITTGVDVLVGEFTSSNQLHPVLYKNIRVQALDEFGNSIFDVNGNPVLKTVKDTLYDEGCHEATKMGVIPNYDPTKKGFDCDDYISLGKLGEFAYRLELYRRECLIGTKFEFVIERSGDIPAVAVNGVAPICDGSSAVIAATIVSTPATNGYKWILNDNTTPIATTKDLTRTFTMDDNNAKLKLETKNVCGTVVSNEITLSILPRPTGIVTTEKGFLCQGQSSDVTAFLAGKAPFTYTLTENTETTTNNVSEIVSMSPASTLDITFESLSDANCVATAADITGTSITVYPQPTVDIAVQVPTPMVSGRYVMATVTPGFESYKLWINNIEITPTTEVNIFKSKDFVYGLSTNSFDTQVVDTNGCTWDFSTTEDITSVLFPNVFTPNNDGVNDVFLEGYTLKVFDRLGTVLYTGTNGWNGTYNGVFVNKGVYLYTVDILDEQGNVVVIKNTVVLEK